MKLCVVIRGGCLESVESDDPEAIDMLFIDYDEAAEEEAEIKHLYAPEPMKPEHAAKLDRLLAEAGDDLEPGSPEENHWPGDWSPERDGCGCGSPGYILGEVHGEDAVTMCDDCGRFETDTEARAAFAADLAAGHPYAQKIARDLLDA